MYFKFNQAWTSADSYRRDFDLHEKHDLHVVYWGKEGDSPVEMCTVARCLCKVTISSHASLCKWMSSSWQSSWFLFVASTAKMPQYVRDLYGNLIILFFFSFGNRELKVGREYMVNVFNGFINAWFGLLILTSISYDYANIWEWLNFFGFFVLPFFQNKQKIKTKSGSKRPFY